MVHARAAGTGEDSSRDSCERSVSKLRPQTQDTHSLLQQLLLTVLPLEMTVLHGTDIALELKTVHPVSAWPCRTRACE